jgi:hypothetical protein
VSGSFPKRLEDRAGLIGVALIVTVVVLAGAVIADRGSSAAPVPAPPGGPVNPLPVPPAIQPIDRLHGQAAAFNHSTGGWTAGSATLAVSTTAEHGAGSLAMTSTSTGGTMTAWSPREPAQQLDRYVGSADLRAVSQAGTARAKLRFINADGKVTDTEPGQSLPDSPSAWAPVSSVAAIAPKGTMQVQLGVSFTAPTAGEQQLIDHATLQQTPGGSAAVVGPLTTRGNQILDGNGRPLILRGLQRFGLEGGTKTPLPTNAEIGELKLWGANEVRISLGEQKWLNSSCQYQADYPQVVDRVVRWVTSRGMVALLNLHFADIGDCGTPGLTPMADSPGAITFWQEVASRYKDNPLVAFDLFNEPNVPPATWLFGGTFRANGEQVQAAGMQQLYDTVRGTGANNLVVVSGIGEAETPPTQLVDGVNIAYGAHAYQCSTVAPPKCAVPKPYDGSVPLHRWDAFAKHNPVIVTEFGFPDYGVDGRYNTSVVAYAESHGWGWSGFAWDGGTDGLFDLVQNTPASDGTTIEPNAGGMALVAGFARNWPSDPAAGSG